MKEALRYFFGAGSEPEFALFTPAHFAPVILMVLVILVIRKKRETIRESRYEVTLRYILAFAVLISDMSYYWRLANAPWLSSGAVDNLPIGVCCWAAILCSFMLVGKCQTIFDIVYFWLLSGSLFALITPTPLTYAGPTRFRYYQFWFTHTLTYISVFYMIFVHGMRPTVRSAVKSFSVLVGLCFLAYWVNTMIPGANYLFLARPEAAPSVLDILPPNFALRTSIMVGGILLMYALAYLPWYLRDKKAAKAS